MKVITLTAKIVVVTFTIIIFNTKHETQTIRET